MPLALSVGSEEARACFTSASARRISSMATTIVTFCASARWIACPKVRRWSPGVCWASAALAGVCAAPVRASKARTSASSARLKPWLVLLGAGLRPRLRLVLLGAGLGPRLRLVLLGAGLRPRLRAWRSLSMNRSIRGCAVGLFIVGCLPLGEAIEHRIETRNQEQREDRRDGETPDDGAGEG